MKRVRSLTGFTLIELLIVVAIIAILALIAVPNFLEAQTRSKISRVKADMRTLKTAMEAYYIDENSYPLDDANPTMWPGYPGGVYETLYYIQLTTPIAYLSSGYLKDPFRRKDRVTIPNPRDETDKIEIGTGDASNPNPVSSTADNDRPSRDCYIVVSCGPDMADDSQAQRYPHVAYSPGQYRFYDPTNGTVSAGDIAKIGGVPTWMSMHPLVPSDWK